jgi:hypothetical protein
MSYLMKIVAIVLMLQFCLPGITASRTDMGLDLDITFPVEDLWAWGVKAANTGRNLTGNDMRTTITVDSETAQSFNLPEITTNLVGAVFSMVRLGTGFVTLVPYSGQAILVSGSGNAGETFSKLPIYQTVTLQAVSTTKWRVMAGDSPGSVQAFPVATNVAINQGDIVCQNTGGYSRQGGDVAGLRFSGIAAETVDNTGGADGAKWIIVFRRGVFKLAASSITQAMVGTAMYIVNATTIDDATGPTNDVRVGVLVKYISNTEGCVDLEM